MAAFGSLRRTAIALALLAGAGLVHGADEPPLRVMHHQVFEGAADPGDASRPENRLRLTLAVLRGTGWDVGPIVESTRRAMRVLAQCGIHTASIELAEFEGPDRYRTLYSPVSAQLAAELGLPKPTVFFVADTRHRPAFDAEAVGRGNSRTRPAMADTVWIVRGTRDLEVVIAHELVHVLADSGEHSDEAGNLMREDSAQVNTLLSQIQCERIVKTGTANGLLQPSHR